jgi:hypothetical protein
MTTIENDPADWAFTEFSSRTRASKHYRRKINLKDATIIDFVEDLS